MSEHTELEAQLRTNPDDVAAPLVYADLLVSRGDLEALREDPDFKALVS